jgi:hypothetical protein
MGMKTTALLLAGLMLASALPLRAQVASGPVVPAKPKATCVCSSPGFKPLNDKAAAVAEYWAARRKYKTASTMIGTFGFFAILARDVRAINDAQNALGSASAELQAARTKAENLDGIKTTNGDDETVEIKLVKGVDYTTTP